MTLRSAGEWVRGRGGVEAGDAGWMGGGPFWGAGHEDLEEHVSECFNNLGPRKSLHLVVLAIYWYSTWPLHAGKPVAGWLGVLHLSR